MRAAGSKSATDMRVKGSPHLFAAGDVAGLRMVVHHAHIEAGIAAENACSDGDRKWTKRSNIEVIFSDPEFAFAGCPPADAEKDGYQLVSACAESRDIGKLHLAGDDSGFGEFWADAKTGRLISAGLLCNDAANLIHLPAYAIDHEHTIASTGGRRVLPSHENRDYRRDRRRIVPKIRRSSFRSR